MLDQDQVRAIFTDECAAAKLTGVQIVDMPLRPYVESSLASEFIRTQIRVGIYDETNIYEDFLSYSRSYVAAGVLHYCYELIAKHSEGVPDDVTRAYLQHVARHEIHHFLETDRPGSVLDHIHAEQHANESMDLAAEKAWMSQSPGARRVMARIEAIKERLANV